MSKGRLKFRWKDDVEIDIMGFVIWRQLVQNRDGWRKESGEALILLGEWSHRTRGKSRRRIRRRAGLRSSLDPVKGRKISLFLPWIKPRSVCRPALGLITNWRIPAPTEVRFICSVTYLFLIRYIYVRFIWRHSPYLILRRVGHV